MTNPQLGDAWPPRLTEGRVTLRPLRRRDRRSFQQARERNQGWLAPWEATSPDPLPVVTFRQLVAASNRAGRSGESVPLAIEVDGEFAGQINLNCVTWGSLRGGSIGYWIDQRFAGQGVMPTAVAMLTDHAILGLGLHRVEINIRPENAASLRVVQKLGFRDEGLRLRFLHIDGGWRDHRTFAVTAEDLRGGLMARWRRTQGGNTPPRLEDSRAAAD